MCERHDTVLINCLVNSRLISVDRCIAPLIVLLLDNGFNPIASCCGHGMRPGKIALKDGRELIIARNYEEAREIDRLFPLDINGNVHDSQGVTG